jgi:rubrerythrin
MKAGYAAICARIIRDKLIMLDIKKKKIIEDKKANSLHSIENEHNELISIYNYYAKMALKDRKKTLDKITT